SLRVVVTGEDDQFAGSWRFSTAAKIEMLTTRETKYTASAWIHTGSVRNRVPRRESREESKISGARVIPGRSAGRLIAVRRPFPRRRRKSPPRSPHRRLRSRSEEHTSELQSRFD